jgi:hypothetical protein
MRENKNSTGKDLLKEHLELLGEATKWRKRSYIQCKDINTENPINDDNYDRFESLTSWFSRVIDMLIHNVFRSNNAYELEDGGTILDIINRAHKRRIFESVDEIRNMKDLRNDISHEYNTESLIELFKETLSYTPSLIELAENTQVYCERYFK